VRKLTWFPLLILAVAALAFGACGGDDDDANGGADTGSPDAGGAAETAEVEAMDFAFTPKAIEATVGETLTVTFGNVGSAPHTFTIDEFAVDQELEAGADAVEVPVTPNEIGEFNFFCRFHSQMVGTITVTQ